MTERVRLASTPAHDPAALAHAILADPRFRLTSSAARPRPKTPLVALFEWLRGLYERLMNALHLHVHVSPTASSLAGEVIIVALALVLLLVIVRLLREIVPEWGGMSSIAAPIERAPDTAELYERSREAASREAFSRAVALLFAATIAGLDAREIVRNRASITVGELRDSLRRSDAALLPSFDAIAKPFVAAAYAGTPVTEADWLAAHAAFIALFREALHLAA